MERETRRKNYGLVETAGERHNGQNDGLREMWEKERWFGRDGGET